MLLVVVTFFSTMGGGIFALRQSRIEIRFFYAFAAGALLGISFFDIIPEAISISIEGAVPLNQLMYVIVIAFLTFHVLDGVIALYPMKGSHAERGLQLSGRIKATGLSVHSFLEGVAIGAAFHVAFELGLIVALAVVFHDFSDGLNIVTVMLRSKSNKRAAYGWLFLNSVTPILGAVITFLFSIPINALVLVLSFFTGEFLYLGASDLLPEAHRYGSSLKLLLATICGISVIFLVTSFLQL